MSSSSLGVESFGFSTKSIISSAKSESLTFSLTILMPFISFCCLIAEARTSSTMLNRSGDSGHPCRVPDLRGKALSISPEMRFTARMPTISTAIQHSTRSPSLSNQTTKRNKRHPNWQRRSQTVTLCR